MTMAKFMILLVLVLSAHASPVLAAQRADDLKPTLIKAYHQWRQAMITKNYQSWRATTASYRQMRVRNQIVSEKRPFPQAIFDNPMLPPSIASLDDVGILVKQNSAAMTLFGKVDFGIGGTPTQNAITLLFVRENRGWKYDSARFFNLSQMPELRQKLAKKDANALTEEGFQPLDQVPSPAPPCNAPRFIAKLFVDCPGRLVEATINGISHHRLTDTREAEIIWGGADIGENQIELKISDDPEGTPKGPLEVTVYLMPEIEGNVPVAAYQLKTNTNDAPPPVKTTFTIDRALLAKGKR